MTMYRLRVSTLEQYRRLMQTSYGDEQELIDRIVRGQWSNGGPTNWKMEAGTAWHRALEGKPPDSTGNSENGDDLLLYTDHWFRRGDVERAMEFRGPGLCEVKVTKTFGNVVVEGTCDHIRGLEIRDAKTKFDGTDPRDYEHSLQWRFYLSLFGADRFTYDCFEFKMSEEDRAPLLKDIVSFSFWRYEGMERELQEWVNAFDWWATCRGVIQYLEPRRLVA